MTPVEIAAIDRAFLTLDTHHPYDYDSYEEDKAYLESVGCAVTRVKPNSWGDDILVDYEDNERLVSRSMLWAAAKEVAEAEIYKAAPKLLAEVKRLQKEASHD